MRYWRGELSLGQSYWLSNLAVWCLITALTLGAQLLPYGQPRLLAGCGLVVMGVIVAGGVWHAVGTWRAAARAITARRLQKRRTIWAHIARVVIILGGFGQAAAVVFLWAPFSWTNLQVLAGHETMGRHSVALRNQGREIDVSGTIGLGVTEEARRLLAASPSVRTVDLDSHGGRLAEARALRDLIRAHDLATYVATRCASACTIAFLGGDPRILRQGAKLGFHHSYVTGLFGATFPVNDMYARTDFAGREVPADFIDHVFATPGQSIWIPGNDELLAAHVVTTLSDGMGYSAAAGGWMTTTGGASAALLGSPSYVALQRRAPELFGQAVSAAVAAAKQDATLGQALDRAQIPLLAGFRRYMRVADDPLQLDMVRLVGDEGRYLGHAHPAQCAVLLGRKTSSASGYFAVLPAALQEREVAITGAVIDAGATRPTMARASQAELAALLKQIRSTHSDSSETEEIADPFCRTMVRLMDGLAALPADRLGPIMRRLYAGPG